ncbi:ClpX C4-type zinc finger protein [Allobranchiibius huperziae]|uniref:ATP-dependent Clp protease ATP-binding subunit ClpX n=1 Tax=Allobranchiibius huperziae TaxID=1874116 RepID=A0A853DHI0_9MICO|nr:ClpX C4-type zinc finger protein [Allobranchiibius huperziae]NYJ74494.1 ATP-dependent Clp protease ATP-binding subunit ClpX [Allobranchiibius huperziae]
MPTLQTTTVRCSFCAKDEKDIAQIIAGPGIYICNECVQLCNEILAGSAPDHAPAELPELPYWQSMSDEQMLDLLPKIAGVADQVETGLGTWVTRLRDRGVTWSRIGTALGMTRQSAWGRFSGEE